VHQTKSRERIQQNGRYQVNTKTKASWDPKMNIKHGASFLFLIMTKDVLDLPKDRGSFFPQRIEPA